MKILSDIKLLVLVIASMLIVWASCNSRTIKGSGNVSSESRTISDFSRVDVRSALKVIYTEGPEYKVEVVADDNLVKYITTELHGNELQISIQDKKSFKHVTKAEVHVTAPSLSGIEASGASTFEALGVLHTGDLNLQLSGASSANFSVQMSSLIADLSGASNVTISGTATSVSLQGSGASVYHTNQLTTGSAAINLSGASNGSITVQTTLTATLSGASNLDYYGSPTVNSTTSGASTITKK